MEGFNKIQLVSLLKGGNLGKETNTWENAYEDGGKAWGEVESMEDQKFPAGFRPRWRHR